MYIVYGVVMILERTKHNGAVARIKTL